MQSVARPPRSYFGWRVVAAAFTIACFGWGLGYYGPAIYLHQVVARPEIALWLGSLAVTWHFLSGALVVANLPALYARFGIPGVTICGAVSLGVGVWGWSAAGGAGTLLLAATLSGIGWVTLSAAALNAIVSPWFVQWRPAALSIAYNGASIGGLVFSAAWPLLIGGLGFASAAATLGLSTILVASLIALWIFSVRPADLGLGPDGVSAAAAAAAAATAPRHKSVSGRALWTDRRFATLALATALGLAAQMGLLSHLYSLLVPAFGPNGAGFAMSAATGLAIVGRSIATRLMRADVNRRSLSCASVGVQLAGALLLLASAGDNPVLLLAGVCLFGLGIGNAASLPPLIAQAEFNEQEVQRVVSLVMALSQCAYAIAPLAFGLLREVFPSVIFVVAPAVMQLLAIGCLASHRE